MERFGEFICCLIFGYKILEQHLLIGESMNCKIGYGKIYLWVFEGNIKARKFYEKVGFVHDGTIQNLDFVIPLNGKCYFVAVFYESLPYKKISSIFFIKLIFLYKLLFYIIHSMAIHIIKEFLTMPLFILLKMLHCLPNYGLSRFKNINIIST